MALANLAALNAQLYGGSQRVSFAKAASNVVLATGCPMLNSHWALGLPTGVVPTAAAICDRTTVGGMASYGWQNKIGTEQRLWMDRYDVSYASTVGPVLLLLVDRLAANGGLSGTVTTAQSNGAWPALTRSTSGVGVWAAIENYASVGATATTATLSYTNDAGGAATSPAFDVGASGRNGLQRVIPISVANGDKGVKAVTSVTLAATTGTAGNFGITLYKTLATWTCNNTGIPISHNGRPLPFFGQMPVIPDNACLQLLCVTGFNASVGIIANIRAFED